jgi:dihydrofolate reductase
MGGGMLYNATVEKADFLYITKIFAEVSDADTFFPAIDENIWEIAREGEILHDEENDIDFQFVVYKRKR